jgi:hypothetical protein
MANTWFRMYAEFADDPEVQMMPEAMQRRLTMLFCERCKEETLRETARAFHWRITEQELAETKALFLEKGFIDEGWNLLNWNKRQFLSDSSTDRVRRHREAKKQDETLHAVSETPEVATVTPPDTDTDTDTKKKPSRDKRECDPRHAAFKAAVMAYAAFKRVKLAWDGSEAKALDLLLKSLPEMTVQEFQACLNNRAHSSGVPHGERPRVWLPHIAKYQQGPLNEFGKTETPAVTAAAIGMAKTTSAYDEDAALSYWKAMKEKGASVYEKDAPRWVKKKLEAKDAA